MYTETYGMYMKGKPGTLKTYFKYVILNKFQLLNIYFHNVLKRFDKKAWKEFGSKFRNLKWNSLFFHFYLIPDSSLKPNSRRRIDFFLNLILVYLQISTPYSYYSWQKISSLNFFMFP